MESHGKGELQLDQIKLNIGDMMQLHIQSGLTDARYYVTLVGYSKSQSVIVTTPQEDGKVMLIREGQHFVVRFFGGKNAYAFSSIARKVTNVPFPHLHLAYPKEVRGMVVRRSSRAKVNIIGSVAAEGGVRSACQVRDISMGGASLSSRNPLGKIGDGLLLDVRVKVQGIEQILKLDCEIRSCHEDHAQQSEIADPSRWIQGVSFKSLGVQETLVLTAMLYHSLLGQTEDDGTYAAPQAAASS